MWNVENQRTGWLAWLFAIVSIRMLKVVAAALAFVLLAIPPELGGVVTPLLSFLHRLFGTALFMVGLCVILHAFGVQLSTPKALGIASAWLFLVESLRPAGAPLLGQPLAWILDRGFGEAKLLLVAVVVLLVAHECSGCRFITDGPPTKSPGNSGPHSTVHEDVVSALVNQGWRRATAEKAIAEIEGVSAPAFEPLFRATLSRLSSHPL